ncbi:hypothetical protein F2P81_023346 [Scophthalmus maximus]|uniref:Uncharacterized protein n=1 Tax=Scophthalmus maximus TaxID=52904 RepID=A0A6A4S206_SCOMX|nr:hypothetical protein F2P81_023346 [Scophthalmus maximus]
MHKAFAKQLLKCFGLKQYFITSCQVSRLMPTCSLFKWILEEKDFKVCQLTAVDMNLSPQEEVMPQSAVAISTIVVGNVIWWMVMIAAIGLVCDILRGEDFLLQALFRDCCGNCWGPLTSLKSDAVLALANIHAAVTRAATRAATVA